MFNNRLQKTDATNAKAIFEKMLWATTEKPIDNVSSMIPSARPRVPTSGDHYVQARLFCDILKSGTDVRTDLNMRTVGWPSGSKKFSRCAVIIFLSFSHFMSS